MIRILLLLFILLMAVPGHATEIFLAGDSRMTFTDETTPNALLGRLTTQTTISGITFLPAYSAVGTYYGGKRLKNWIGNAGACNFASAEDKYYCFRDVDNVFIQIGVNDLVTADNTQLTPSQAYTALMFLVDNLHADGKGVIILTEFPLMFDIGGTVADSEQVCTSGVDCLVKYNGNALHYINHIKADSHGALVIDWWTEIYTNFLDYDLANATYDDFFLAHLADYPVHMDSDFYGYEAQYVLEQLQNFVVTKGSASGTVTLSGTAELK